MLVSSSMLRSRPEGEAPCGLSVTGKKITSMWCRHQAWSALSLQLAAGAGRLQLTSSPAPQAAVPTAQCLGSMLSHFPPRKGRSQSALPSDLSSEDRKCGRMLSRLRGLCLEPQIIARPAELGWPH